MLKVVKANITREVKNVSTGRKQVRCPFCNKRIADSLPPSSLEIQCHACGWAFSYIHSKPYQNRMRLNKKSKK